MNDKELGIITERLDNLIGRFDRQDKKFDKQDEKIETQEKKIVEQGKKISFIKGAGSIITLLFAGLFGWLNLK